MRNRGAGIVHTSTVRSPKTLQLHFDDDVWSRHRGSHSSAIRFKSGCILDRDWSDGYKLGNHDDPLGDCCWEGV